ncbi:MAG: hypothetical protein JWQ96_369 [Segetibacter sp.]|nr:hypothetical protein [Segetibacter sp.]
MKYLTKLLLLGVILSSVVVTSTSCKKVLGLQLQENWEFQPVVLDPHINKSAWDFLKDRALGKVPADTIFKLMYNGIMYAGIDTNLYMQPGKTFIFLHTDAIRRGTNTDSYWGYYKVGTPLKVGTKWEDYPKETVKNWLLYLIADGEHNFGTVNHIVKEVQTAMPKNADPKNPESLIYFSIMNDQNFKFRINDFIGTKRSTQARTAGIIATNGPVHVVDRIVEFNK